MSSKPHWAPPFDRVGLRSQSLINRWRNPPVQQIAEGIAAVISIMHMQANIRAGAIEPPTSHVCRIPGLQLIPLWPGINDLAGQLKFGNRGALAN
jgi:hypothetical protein